MTLQANGYSAQTAAEFISSATQADIQRPYTAAQVERLTPTLAPTPSNKMALSLRAMLGAHRQAFSSTQALGAADAVTLDAVTKAGGEVAYVSGAALSFADTRDPGADLSDYPYDTVARRVAQLTASQAHAAVLNRHLPGFEHRPQIPLIADADSGFGLFSTVMKATRGLVDGGVAGFHLDDLLPGSKRFDHAGGRGAVVVPFAEYSQRLSAAKLQLDMMRSEAVLIGRTDVMDATHITSSVDPVDRPFILGASVRMPASYAAFTSPSEARPEASAADGPGWIAEARLCTLDEAFARATPDARLRSVFTVNSIGLNVADAKRVADDLLAGAGLPRLEWDPEAARTTQGWYAYRGGIDAAIVRSVHAAPLVDMLWACTFQLDLTLARRYASAVKEKFPLKWLMFNTSHARRAHVALSDDELAALPQTLGELGYVLTLVPQFGQAAHAYGAFLGAKATLRGGVGALFDSVLGPYAAATAAPLASDWYGDMGRVADAAMDAVGSGRAGWTGTRGGC
ncbi:hypothetical protein Q8F55_007281 [Vanrija albida]|uniref:methylisocitrate lyase n=1 Tax=Vanrija albida TaxID=181172 RepID=A0ABR3PZH3_9TREE